MFTHAAEIKERRRQFAVLEARGLVVRHQLEDGTAGLTFPFGEEHPAIVAFAARRDRPQQHVIVGDHDPEPRHLGPTHNTRRH